MSSKFRAPQWQTWHHDGIDLNKIRTTDNQILQADSIINFTMVSTKKDFSILEIGPADGGVCSELISKFNNISSYTLVDDNSMLNICKRRLSNFNSINYIEIDNISNLKDTKFDLLISNHCIEETPLTYQIFVYDTFFKNVDEVFILCNTAHSNTWGEFDPAYLESRMREYFNTTISDGHRLSRATQKIYYGSKS
jgi:phospholipid N-methyltransferase